MTETDRDEIMEIIKNLRDAIARETDPKIQQELADQMRMNIELLESGASSCQPFDN